MVFSSHIFLFYFLPITLFIYYLLVWSKVNLSLTNFFITLVSYAFYGWLNPWYVSLMWISTLLDFACGRAISRPEKLNGSDPITKADLAAEFKSFNLFYPFFILASSLYGKVVTSEEKRTKFIRNFALGVSITGNLAMLGFFKYAGFFADSVNKIAGLMGANDALLPVLQILLPAGISFYTFQTMSYTIDVWRGDAPPVKDMATFSCFVALFPQLIAGPIVRYQSVAEQLSYRTHSMNMFTKGTALFIMGLAKKIILADGVGAVADATFGADGPDMFSAWWGIMAYSFQIYFDFTGYSDMAVGLGRILGFEFIQNFNSPYHAQSITDFWRRWHISLSTFIRDYLYIPLGGNRGGSGRTYFNLVITFFLCGLWHGNQLHFLMWGVYQGVMLLYERALGKRTFYEFLPKLGRVFMTNIVILVGWVLFRAPSMDQAWLYWGSLFGFRPASASAPLLHANIFSMQYIVMMGVCAVFTWQPVRACEFTEKLTSGKLAIIGLLFFMTIVLMFTQAFSPFLYFQF